MTTATTRSRARKARKVSQDEKPQERKALTRLGAATVPWVDEDIADLWKSHARAAVPEAPACVDLAGFEDATAAFNADVDDAIAGHRKRAGEYDRQERGLRGWQVKHARPPRHVPVAVATKSGAFYRLNSAGQMEAIPLDEKAEKHMAEILRLHAEQDGTPLDDPGPVPAPSPPGLAADSPVPLPSQGAGPGSRNDDDPALD